jgi:hypothetical protein
MVNKEFATSAANIDGKLFKLFFQSEGVDYAEDVVGKLSNCFSKARGLTMLRRL